MPTLPLFDPTAHPDGWHNVRSPGGYEWWYFDAEDRATNTQIVVILMQGFIFHPGYLRAYDRYMKRPTKRLPPTAGDYPCAYACVYKDGKIWKQFFTQYGREDFEASRDGATVRIGPNRLWADEQGGYQLELEGSPWRLTGRGPITDVEQLMKVRMSFTPTQKHPPIERTFLSREMTSADHKWTIAAPRCEVKATIDVVQTRNTPRRDAERSEASGPVERELTKISSEPSSGEILREYAQDDGVPRPCLSGHGYHDHNYGTAPIRQGLHRWIWGRAMFGDRVLTFHHAEPKSNALPAETHLVEVRDSGARDIVVPSVRANWSLACKMAMMLKYPSVLVLGEELQLSNPRVIDPSPFYLRLVFDAVSRGESSQAFCEIAYPHRLTWPILGRMIEMSFDKRPCRK